MLNPQFATNYHALQSLSNSYNIQWNGLYSMYALINLWAEKKTIGCKKIKLEHIMLIKDKMELLDIGMVNLFTMFVLILIHIS